MRRQTADGRRESKATGRLPFFFCIPGAAIAVLVLFGACAKQAPPPGGPPDLTPPGVVWTFPAADSVGVGLKEDIRIGFSERMDRRSVERAVFISPRPASDPTFRWRGPELEIRLEGDLRPDRTYRVTVGAESADEWRNRMVASYSFAFATGRALNRGEVSGQVFTLPSGSSEQIYVWAYDLGEEQNPDPGQLPPAYVTQPDAGGGYAFPRLGPGRYRIFAFGDRNGDRVYTPGADPLAVPPGDAVLILESDRVRLGMLRMALRDTVPPRLLSVRTIDQRHLLLRFDEPVRLPAELSADGPDGPLEVLALYQDPEDSSRVGLLTAPQRSGAAYRVDLTGLADRSGNRVVPGEEARVRGDGRPDRRLPTVVSVFPEMDRSDTFPDAPLLVDFSEAMAGDIPSEFWVRSDSTVAPEGRFSWVAPNRLQFRPDLPWTPGQTYRLVGRSGRLSDPSGNVLEAAPTFFFGIYAPDDPGGLTGALVPTDAPVVVEARRLSPPQRRYRTPVAPGDSLYILPELIPGQYRVVAFLDRDGDGEWTAGTVLPFAPAEPMAEVADTLEVRPRWEAVADRTFRMDAWFVEEK